MRRPFSNDILMTKGTRRWEFPWTFFVHTICTSPSKRRNPKSPKREEEKKERKQWNPANENAQHHVLQKLKIETHLDVSRGAGDWCRGCCTTCVLPPLPWSLCENTTMELPFLTRDPHLNWWWMERAKNIDLMIWVWEWRKRPLWVEGIWFPFCNGSLRVEQESNLLLFEILISPACCWRFIFKSQLMGRPFSFIVFD